MLCHKTVTHGTHGLWQNSSMEKPMPLTLPLEMFDVAKLESDPALYQFRRNGDAKGVTQKHKIEGEWNPLLHGDPLIVHERLDGRVFIADGHHRFAFAKQLAAEGKGPEKLAAYVLREKDGISVQDAKLMAAYANMSRGDTDVAESARVFKEAREPSVHQQFLPSLQMDKGNLKIAYTLSSLSDTSLKKVEAGVVPVEAAVMVAERVKDAERQDRVMEIIGVKLKQDYPNFLPNNALAVTLAPKANDNFSKGFVDALKRERDKTQCYSIGA
jgi:hypothetical protein